MAAITRTLYLKVDLYPNYRFQYMNMSTNSALLDDMFPNSRNNIFNKRLGIIISSTKITHATYPKISDEYLLN